MEDYIDTPLLLNLETIRMLLQLDTYHESGTRCWFFFDSTEEKLNDVTGRRQHSPLTILYYTNRSNPFEHSTLVINLHSV